MFVFGLVPVPAPAAGEKRLLGPGAPVPLLPVLAFVLVPVPAPAVGVEIFGPGAVGPPVAEGVVVNGLMSAAGTGFAWTWGPGAGGRACC